MRRDAETRRKRPLRASVCWLLALVATACGPKFPPGTTRKAEAKWPSGVVRCVGTEVFQDGTWHKDGVFVFYDEDGDEFRRGGYTLGLESGVWEEHYEDGGTGHGSFLAGERQGTWSYMYKNGRLQQRGAYESGKRVGTWEDWSPAGERRPDLVYPAP